MLFDQFEEYFLYHDHERGPGTFDAEFPQAVNRAELRANFLLSIRDDALARLDRFKGRIPNLFENRLQIDHLKIAAARDAVKLPIQEYNRRVAPEQRVEIEDELVDDVLDQVRTGRVSFESTGAGIVRRRERRRSASRDADPPDRADGTMGEGGGAGLPDAPRADARRARRRRANRPRSPRRADEQARP